MAHVVGDGRCRRPNTTAHLAFPSSARIQVSQSIPAGVCWSQKNVKALVRKGVSHAAYTLAVLARIGKEDVCHALARRALHRLQRRLAQNSAKLKVDARE